MHLTRLEDPYTTPSAIGDSEYLVPREARTEDDLGLPICLAPNLPLAGYFNPKDDNDEQKEDEAEKVYSQICGEIGIDIDSDMQVGNQPIQ